ncbi:MAG: PDZ domain-containing protein [Planctomycetota bacterium]
MAKLRPGRWLLVPLGALGIAASVLLAREDPVARRADDARQRAEATPTAQPAAKQAPPAAPAAPPPTRRSWQVASSLGKALRHRAVCVTVHVGFDGGDAPTSLGTHGGTSDGLVEGLREERQRAYGGWLLDARHAVIEDPMMHPRFVSHLEVQLADRARIPGRIVGYLDAVDGVLVRLDTPARGIEPLTIAHAAGPYYRVAYDSYGLRWGLHVGPALESVHMRDDGEDVLDAGGRGLIVATDGSVVGYAAGRYVPLQGGWKSSPQGWRHLTDVSYATGCADLDRALRTGLLRVRLRFRSPPRTTEATPDFLRRSGDEDAEAVTDMDTLGLLIDPGQVLVLAELLPRMTARLEAIEIHLPDGAVVTARHRWSLRAYGAFVALTDSPLRGALPRKSMRTSALLGRLLFTARVEQRADRRVQTLGHVRAHEMEVGFAGSRCLDFPADIAGHFLFLPGGELVAMSLQRREDGVRPRWRDPECEMVPVDFLDDLARKPDAHVDATNRPAPADREGRRAWLGVELQSLDQRLARANDVAHLTEDGQVGSLVAYVYEGSPAHRLGIRTGDILLRLRSSGRPTPLALGGAGSSSDDDAPWRSVSHLDLFGRASRPPWPVAEGTISRGLNSLELGSICTLEWLHEGTLQAKPIVLSEGPVHFEAARHATSEELGLTARDLTYEVRRHFRLAADAPGVVIAEVEEGRPAGIAGIEPYQILSEINGQPVRNVQAFAEATRAKGEHRLTLRDVAREHVVLVRVK